MVKMESNGTLSSLALKMKMPNTSTPMPLPFDFEKLVNRDDVKAWLDHNWHQSFYWSALYLVLVFGCQSYMKNRPPFNLRYPLVLWNLFLALFSICGTIRMIPGFLHTIQEFGIHYSICFAKYPQMIQPTVFWGWLFITSKVLELGDTLFVVLRKQKLIFLHWYHHIMTLIFCWYNSSREVSLGHWFITMNYFVHSFMYTYFAFRAMRIHVPRFIAMVITTLQIIQMIFGVSITVWAYKTVSKGNECETPENTLELAFLVYLSYALLFCHLFYQSYIVPILNNNYEKKIK